MNLGRAWNVLFAFAIVAGITLSAQAQKPWSKLIPFKRIDADPNRAYWLTDQCGPWLIFATSFAGPGAEDQAQRLVYEIRRNLKVPAYMHKQSYDFTESIEGLGLNKYGEAKRMRHAKASQFEEIAVLVGNFPSVDDGDAQKVLEKVKYAQPDSLNIYDQEGRLRQSTQRFIGLREFQRKVSLNSDTNEKGPMRRAFVARNPLLPEEFFVSSGLDPLVKKMNRQVKHSLLENPGRYTVRVASFTGDSTFVGEKHEAQKKKPLRFLPFQGEASKLELAAEYAHQMTDALRKNGIEAWEFHDRHESLVTVGSFDSVGYPRQDGKTEINPEVLRIMETFGAARHSLPNQPYEGLRPRAINGIPFDVQPMPVVVPRESIGDRYAREAQ